MSNFSGSKYPLEWINLCTDAKFIVKGLSGNMHPMKWFTLLDAAAFVPTNELDLSLYPADFVTVSFYKMFGYPTGLGALLVRNKVSSLLHTVYFGGGTVDAYASNLLFHVPRSSLHDRLEHGTLPFLDILSLRHGFSTMLKIGGSMQQITQHTFQLARIVYNELKVLRHHNGQPVCHMYCLGDYSDSAKQGGIVNFNILDEKGHYVGYSQVEQLTATYGIHLRTGCFCNTGACQIHLGLSSDDISTNLKAGHVCGDSVDIVEGKPTGSVRISFGYMSTKKDAEVFIQFIKDCFVKKLCDQEKLEHCETPAGNHECPQIINEHNYDYLLTWKCDLHVGDVIKVSPQAHGSIPIIKIEEIAIFPVKSCRAFVVKMWPMSDTGLLYDREWVIVGQNGAAITQKQNSKLCGIQTSIDLKEGVLTLSATSFGSVNVHLSMDSVEEEQCDMRICGQRVRGVECSCEASKWLTDVLGTHCKLIRKNPLFQRIAKEHTKSKDNLSFANQAQYLLISQSSTRHLHTLLQSNLSSGENESVHTVSDLTERFRANLVVSGSIPPFSEDGWKYVSIGSKTFNVLGPCTRCQMICINQSSGEREREPLQTLFSARGSKAHFGIYLSYSHTQET
jgi:molybdenum cofactor sulfurtransferase